MGGAQEKSVAGLSGERSLQDDQFLQRIGEKIQRLTGCRVDLEIDREDMGTLRVELDREVPLVVMGANIYEYAGFARMCIEYATASIRERRSIDVLEFHLILARN